MRHRTSERVKKENEEQRPVRLEEKRQRVKNEMKSKNEKQRHVVRRHVTSNM